MATPPEKLLDQNHNWIRLKCYSIRTEQSYTSWIRRFIFLPVWTVTQSQRRCLS